MGRWDAEKYLALHAPVQNGAALPSPCLLQAAWPRTLSEVMRYRRDLVTGDSWTKAPEFKEPATLTKSCSRSGTTGACFNYSWSNSWAPEMDLLHGYGLDGSGLT